MSQTSTAPDVQAGRKPRLIVTLGRGRTGKTVFLSWLREIADPSFPVRIIDADVNNPVLSERFSDVAKPRGMDDDRRNWLEDQFEEQVNAAAGPDRYDVLLDLGGGDLLIKRWGAELQLADLFASAEIDPVAIHMLGSDPADLAYLEDIEGRKLFCPERTILVLNQGLIPPSRSAGEAFADILNSEVVKAVISRGGRVVVMPRLACMEYVWKLKVPFQQAQDPYNGIRLFDRLRVRYWLNTEMEEMRTELGGWIG